MTSRLAIAPMHRALVFAALGIAALYTSVVLTMHTAGAVAVLVVGALPAALLPLQESPISFRVGAAVLALFYGTLTVWGLVLFAPFALILLVTALLPWTSVEIKHRRRRRLWYLGVVVAAFTALAATLVLMAI